MSFEVLSWADNSLGQITRVGLEILSVSCLSAPHSVRTWGPPFIFLFFPLQELPLRSFFLFGVGPRCKQFGVTLRNAAQDSSLGFWSTYRTIGVAQIWYCWGYNPLLKHKVIFDFIAIMYVYIYILFIFIFWFHYFIFYFSCYAKEIGVYFFEKS